MSNDLDQLSVDDVIEPYTDEHEEETGADYPGGTTPESYSLPDESPRVQLIEEIRETVREEIERERRQFAGLSKNTIKVNQNVSGEVLFSRYTVGNRPHQICREKVNRGIVRIRVLPGTDGEVSIGRQVGVLPGGADTMTIRNDSTTGMIWEAELRTMRSLWAIAEADTVIEVIEEFD